MPISGKEETVLTSSEGGCIPAMEPIDGATAISEVPAEEQLVFRPSRALPRSPVRDRTSPYCQPECGQEPHKMLSPSRTNTWTATSPGVKGLVERIEAEETIRCKTPALSPASPLSKPPAATCAPVRPRASAAAPDLAPSGQDAATPPGSSSCLHDGASRGTRRRHSQPSTAAASHSVFTPSHVLARSPPKQVAAGPKSPQGVCAGHPSPARSPKQPARPGAALPRGSSPASVDVNSPQRQLSTHSGLLEADKKQQADDCICASSADGLDIRWG